MVDRDGWHFTNNGKYTVKSRYHVERVYPDMNKPPLLFGPTVDVLKAFCWKIRYPPKIKHFLWQLVTRCIAVKKNPKERGIHGDICCTRCGADEESINMCFLNVLQHFKFELSQRYHQIQLFFQQARYSQIWIISSGEFFRRWIIISLYGYYGIFGKEWIIKFLIIWTLILGTRLIWQKHNQHFGLRYIYWTNRGMYKT